MTTASFHDGTTLICLALGLKHSEFLAYAEEDTVGGFPEKWAVGSIWDVEGRVLYALTRILRPDRVIEFGTRYGCSTAHFAAAMDRNEKGKITTVDIVGTSLSGDLHHRVSSVGQDGVEYAREQKGSVDIIFEDGPHSTEFTRDVITHSLPHLTDGGIVVVHDTEHFLVGKQVSQGFQEAVGDFGSVLIRPSDCGLGYWRKHGN
jgi:predicted O-methyltransferase YrrM